MFHQGRPTTRAKALCYVFAGLDVPEPPSVLHEMVASGIVATRRQLERLKHFDLGTDEERELLAAYLNSVEGFLTLVVGLGWAAVPDEKLENLKVRLKSAKAAWQLVRRTFAAALDGARAEGYSSAVRAAAAGGGLVRLGARRIGPLGAHSDIPGVGCYKLRLAAGPRTPRRRPQQSVVGSPARWLGISRQQGAPKEALATTTPPSTRGR